MAILTGLPGIEVTIVVDGKPLKEHVDTDMEEEDRTVTRYVEAESGKCFEIHARITDQAKFKGDLLSVECSVDGVVLNSNCASRRSVQKRVSRNSISEGLQISSTRVRKYHFTFLDTVADGHTTKVETKKLSKLGRIDIEIYHKRLVEQPKRRNSFKEEKETAKNEIGIVSEKALKGQALSHSEANDQKRKIKRERQEDDSPATRKRARPSAGDTQLEIEDGAAIQEAYTASLPAREREIIEID